MTEAECHIPEVKAHYNRTPIKMDGLVLAIREFQILHQNGYCERITACDYECIYHVFHDCSCYVVFNELCGDRSLVKSIYIMKSLELDNIYTMER